MTIRKTYVDISGGQIHLRRVEGAGSPIVSLHQTASSGQMWTKTMERLAGRWTMLALDTPGFGGSFDLAPDAKPSTTDYAEWIYEAVKAAGVEKCHLVGHHTGACIAVELAARHSEIVLSLTMIGPVPLTADERTEAAKVYGTPIEPNAHGSYLMENWDYLRKLKADRDVMLIHREMIDQLRAWRGRVQSYAAVWEQDFTSLYEKVNCPILIGAASADVLQPNLERAKEMHPDAEVLEIEGADFEPDFDTDNFADGLEKFLTKHERSQTQSRAGLF